MNQGKIKKGGKLTGTFTFKSVIFLKIFFGRSKQE